jgi:hypothetical protein
MVRAYEEKGMFAEILPALEKVSPPSNSWACSELAYVYGRTGQEAQARLTIARLEELNRRGPVDPVAFVVAYIGTGDKDQAMAWLNKAYAEHSNALTGLKVDPVYDPLRSDSRFQDLLRRVGLN